MLKKLSNDYSLEKFRLPEDRGQTGGFWKERKGGRAEGGGGEDCEAQTCGYKTSQSQAVMTDGY